MRINAAALLPCLLAVTGVFMAWKALSLATDSTQPIIVVVSESMSPAFHRGDVCLIWNRSKVIEVGDIPVIWFQGRQLPMVHRAIESHWQAEDATTQNAT
jgi:signal peptidase